jgi:hypothetical protein
MTRLGSASTAMTVSTVIDVAILVCMVFSLCDLPARLTPRRALTRIAECRQCVLWSVR